MEKEYTKEQLWKLYKKLPEELKEAAFSVENAENIESICKRNGIEEEKISKITKFVGQVFLGLLPPNEFQENLEMELNLEKETAKKVAREINRFIFFPVREALEKLYKIEIAPSTIEEKIVTPTEIKPKEKKPEEKPRMDIYREPIE